MKYAINGNVIKETRIPYPTNAALSAGANPAAIANAPAVIIEGIPDSRTAVFSASGSTPIANKNPNAISGITISLRVSALVNSG